METMKILVIGTVGLQCPPAAYGGSESIAYTHAVELRCLGHEVDVVCSFDSPEDMYAKHGIGMIKTVMSRILPIPENDAFEVWRRRVRLSDYDIIHDHSHSFHSILLQSDSPDGRGTYPPIVRTVHDDMPFPTTNRFRDGVFQAVPPPVKFPCWVSPSFASAFRLERSMPGSVVRTVWHGIPHELYREGSGGERFLFLGRIQWIKGVHAAIEACRYAGVGLDIVGPDTHIPGDVYVQKIRNLCDGVQIKYHGEVSHEKKLEFLMNAKAILVPSQFHEPFGLVVPEANMCGTPAIVSNHGGLVETTINGVTGFICSNRSEYICAISDIERINRSMCRKWALSNFTVTHMVRRYMLLYKDVLEGRMW